MDPSAAPAVAAHRAWDDEWISVPCAACGRPGHWPQPELGCPCGTVLRIPVATTPPADSGKRSAMADTSPMDSGMQSTGSGMQSTDNGIPSPDSDTQSAETAPRTPAHRPAFPPRAIRTARDAVTVAALYLRWLGYRDIRRADQRPPNGIGLAAHGLLAQVDPTVRPAAARDVECLWLTAMTESADCAYFSLAGYTDDARACAHTLAIPLFVLDLAGVPQPANDHADALNAEGAPEPGPRQRDRRS
ncbi:hypothetical protein BFF78_10225 [Streptomyces fodineus]|uniref:Restriction endonuclease type IV Mrr domain-containing protein n=1 Tax=Streptomyces fodineus TaxID=1904616 RepID=A0A1D7YN37_9ACTN|nr:hypothetical protein BFF78_10225 [Streptomyces fodineus]